MAFWKLLHFMRVRIRVTFPRGRVHRALDLCCEFDSHQGNNITLRRGANYTLLPTCTSSEWFWCEPRWCVSVNPNLPKVRWSSRPDFELLCSASEPVVTAWHSLYIKLLHFHFPFKGIECLFRKVLEQSQSNWVNTGYGFQQVPILIKLLSVGGARWYRGHPLFYTERFPSKLEFFLVIKFLQGADRLLCLVTNYFVDNIF